jgi:hypothetical protein
MRCQAIKRDGLQCNYHSRPFTNYCGHHVEYRPPSEDEEPGPSYRPRLPIIPIDFEINVDLIIEALGVTAQNAVSIYIESVELEKKNILDRRMDAMVNSFKSLDVPEDNCSICISTPENLVKTPCCEKEFCKDCLKKWVIVKKNCPACRENL